jgi:hypothetical protein
MMQEKPPLLVTLTIIRYPKKYVFFAILAMAIHRVPLWANKKIHFWKLLGCGKGGGFSKSPDWRQWAILAVREQELVPDTQRELLKNVYGKFIAGWYRFWQCNTNTFLLEPISGHGTWDGKQPFADFQNGKPHEGPIAVLTRATIALKKIRRFWAHVPGTSALLHNAEGLHYSVSIGEIPFIKQATFSIWNSVDEMKAFAYTTPQHADVIQKTRKENWYNEEMFVRFRIIKEFEGD